MRMTKAGSDRDSHGHPMETEGLLSPETAGAARSSYEDLAPAARTVVRETARAMDVEPFDERVTDDVVATAHDALFASLLEVQVGTAEEFERWRDEHDYDVSVVGSQNVDHVVWHAAPFAGRAVAATFQAEREAAVATLRRQAYGRIYREEL